MVSKIYIVMRDTDVRVESDGNDGIVMLCSTLDGALLEMYKADSWNRLHQYDATRRLETVLTAEPSYWVQVHAIDTEEGLLKVHVPKYGIERYF
jgi:hypothetical protein